VNPSDPHGAPTTSAEEPCNRYGAVAYIAAMEIVVAALYFMVVNLIT
jgi:hypothetical protein